MRVWIIVLGLLICGNAFADKEITITVPDEFTDSDITYVKELANVGKERIILKPIIPPDAEISAAKVKIDEYRVKDSLTTKYKAVEPKVEE